MILSLGLSFLWAPPTPESSLQSAEWPQRRMTFWEIWLSHEVTWLKDKDTLKHPQRATLDLWETFYRVMENYDLTNKKTMTKTWLVNSCENVGISDNWEPQLVRIIVTMDSIYNCCKVVKTLLQHQTMLNTADQSITERSQLCEWLQEKVLLSHYRTHRLKKKTTFVTDMKAL